MVNATDQTVFIVRALLRALFIGLTGDVDFAPRSARFAADEIVADLEFDPVNQREAAMVNARLTKLGFCLVLETFMFDPAVGVQSYCSAPLRHGYDPTPIFKAYQAYETAPVEPHHPGILYRPRYPYRLAVYRKRDPGGGGKWLLTQTTTVHLENVSPVLSLGITRAAFTGKAVNFLFQDGALTTACISKGSEIESFVQIPLDVAKSIMAVPASLATIQLGRLENEKLLVQRQEQLFLVQKAYLAKLAGGQATRPTGTPDKTQLAAALPTPQQLGAVPADIAPATPVTFGTDVLGRNLAQICGAS
jgi:hypothetical protein